MDIIPTGHFSLNVKHTPNFELFSTESAFYLKCFITRLVLEMRIVKKKYNKQTIQLFHDPLGHESRRVYIS